MEPLNVYASRLITKKEYFTPGHRACQGCAEALAVRLVAKALGKNVVVASATGCMEIVSSPLPFTNWGVPWIHVAFENAAAVASGAEAGTKALIRKGKLTDKGTVFLGMGGDGATSDIGLQALSGAFERGHNFLYVCYDNEAYIIPVQAVVRDSFGASQPHTSSQPGIHAITPGQSRWKKTPEKVWLPTLKSELSTQRVQANHVDAYLIKKVEKAPGFKVPRMFMFSQFVYRMASSSDKAIWIGRLAVETGFSPV